MDPSAPPGQGDPRERTLLDGTEVKWCSLCVEWGSNYRTGHPAGNVSIDVPPISNNQNTLVIADNTEVDEEVDSEAVSRLR